MKQIEDDIQVLNETYIGGVYSSYDMAKAFVAGQKNVLENLEKEDKHRLNMTELEIKQKANDLAEAVRHAYITGALDNAKGDSETFAEHYGCLSDTAQEEKQLLLKDLCARLPYGVKVTDGLHTITLKVRIDTAPATLAQFMQSENLRYYLRPMSSMTEDEEDELNSARMGNYGEDVDWLNANHFDYRGLIPMGLALEAPEDMYKND